MPVDSSNPIFGSGDQLTPGQQFAKTTNGNLADYFNNPQKYEMAAKALQQQQAQQAPVQNPMMASPGQVANSDAAYKAALQRMAAPVGQNQPAAQQQPQDQSAKIDISPDAQNEYDQQKDAQEKALQELAGNGPRGMR